MAAHPNVTVVEHPLVRHKLTLLRDRRTPTAQFRQLAREISLLWPMRSRAPAVGRAPRSTLR